MSTNLKRPIFAHPNFTKAVAETKRLVLESPPGSILRLVALTGIGKSEICLAVARAIAGPPASWPRGSLPVSIVRARKEESGKFSSKHFASRSLAAVNCPNLEWAYETHTAGSEASMEIHAKHQQTSLEWRNLLKSSNEISLRTGCEESWVTRGVRLAIVDDAHAMTAVRKGVLPSDYLQPWIATAEAARTTMLFSGTTAMLSLWDGEGEIGRRAKSIFVPPYDFEKKNERETFLQILATLGGGPRWKDINLADLGEEIYYVTHGAFGQVKKLFEEAEGHAVNRGASKVTASDLRQVFPSVGELKAIAQRSVEFSEATNPVSPSVAREIFLTRHTEYARKMAYAA